MPCKVIVYQKFKFNSVSCILSGTSRYSERLVGRGCNQ